jgi:hypothetical protein
MPLFAEVAARRDGVVSFCQSGEDEAKIRTSLASSGLPLSDVFIA